MKDLFKASGWKSMGCGGMDCPCCDKGYSKKRKKNKRYKGLFSKLRRSRLKYLTNKEIENEIT